MVEVQSIPARSDEEDKLFVECHEDFHLYAKTNLKIQDIHQNKVCFILNNVHLAARKAGASKPYADVKAQE